MVASNTVSNKNPVVIFDRFSYAYPEAEKFTLRDVFLQIEPGQCHLLEGPTGCGKTTLLLAIRGLLPPGRQSGEIRLRNGSGVSPGLVCQNPVTQLLCANLGADVAFGLENHCVPPGEMIPRVQEALRTVGLYKPLESPLEQLSMGQQYRACIAGQLVLNPLLILLDEPMAQLDLQGREKTLAAIEELKKADCAVLICEHRSQLLGSVVDCCWQFDGMGRLVQAEEGEEVHQAFAAGGQALPQTSSKEGRIFSPERKDMPRELVRVDGPLFSTTAGGLDLRHLNFTVHRGECILLRGPNGSGKTTLLRAVAGLLPPETGRIEVFGTRSKPAEARGRLALLFQEPGRQLFENTVFEEVAFAARRAGVAEKQVVQKVSLLLEQLGIERLVSSSPHKLSYGQKHLVGLAAVLAGGPEVVLLDDPFAGLDRGRKERMLRLIATLAERDGTAFILTSHDTAYDIFDETVMPGWRVDRVVDLTPALPDGHTPISGGLATEAVEIPVNSQERFRLPTGVMLTLCLVLSMLAFGARTPALLAGLSGANLLLLLLFCRERWRLVQKSLLLFFWQAALIMLLYGIRFGFPEGCVPGGRVAWQLFLAFWPGMIFMSANSQPQIVRALSRLLPQRTAFVAATCLRFLPLLLSHMQQIREAQILRGARLLAVDLRNPGNWFDWLRCLLVPTLIKTLSLAAEIATAATARDFGIHHKRTSWPGD